MKGKKGKDNMKKKIRTLLLVVVLTLACATTSLACTPRLVAPKISIPNISGSIKLPENVQEAVNNSAEKHAKEAVKNLKIDWGKFNFNFKFQEKSK